MLRKTGSTVGLGLTDAVTEGVVAPVATLRPWQPRGSLAVDLLLTWAFRDQKVGRATAGLCEVEARAAGIAWHSTSTDGTMAVETYGQLGCRPDGGGAGRDATHPAADAVALAVGQLDREMRIEVMAAALAGGAPGGWEMPTRWLAPMRMLSEDAGAEWIYAEKRMGAHCPLIVVASPETVAARRALYLAWWDALELMAWQLRTRALGFVVEQPSVPREPWGC